LILFLNIINITILQKKHSVQITGYEAKRLYQ